MMHIEKEQPPGNGRHWEALANQYTFYRRTLQDARVAKHKRMLEILDFGTGRLGAGRLALEGVSGEHDFIDLYDPHADVSPPTDSYSRRERVVGNEAVYGLCGDRYDIINISYVLCHLPEAEAQVLLSELREQHPHATFTVIDYILKGRSKAEVLEILTAEEERRWQAKMGDDVFYETHARFTRPSLIELLRGAGLHVADHDAQNLDSAGIRAAVTANNSRNRMLTEYEYLTQFSMPIAY